MKRIILTIGIILSLSLCNDVCSQTFSPYKTDVITYNGYSCPVVPGSDEWKEMKPSERADMLQIPADTLENISTARLLETCLYYPFNIDVFFTDDQIEGFRKIKNKFNGYEELFRREDFLHELTDLYSSRDVDFIEKIDNDYDRGQYSFDYRIMELMMLEVLESSPSQRSIQITDLVAEKQSQRETLKEYYSKDKIAEQILSKSNR